MPGPTKPLSSRSAPAAVFLSPALPVLLILLAAGLPAGCPKPPPEPEPAAALGGTLYQLQEGRFTPVSTGQELPTAFEPWTVQGRVCDLASLGERVYLGVNGYGIAGITFETGEAPDFSYFYDSLIFRYRTLTTLIPEQDTLLCHLYFNKLLNVVSEAEMKLQGISLLRFHPSRGDYQFLNPPFQEKHPDWEAVGFVPVTGQEFFLQWKYSDRNRTLFSYSRFDLAASEDQEIGELSYRKSYRFQDAREESFPALKALLGEARRVLDSPGIATAYQLHIRAEGRSLIRRYEYHPDDFTSAREIRLITLCGVQRGDRLLLLLPDGLLLEANPGARRAQRFRLPPLPAGFLYRDLFLHGQHLLAGWEQSSFTEVGAAGIFIKKFPLIP